MTPRWIWWALAGGAVGLMLWGWLLTQLLHALSPGAGLGAALKVWSAWSTISALGGIAALFTLPLAVEDRVRRAAATAAAIMMTIAVVGAVIGIPVLWTLHSDRARTNG